MTKTPLVALLAAGLILLGGCGGDSDATDAKPSGQDRPGQKAHQAEKKANQATEDPKARKTGKARGARSRSSEQTSTPKVHHLDAAARKAAVPEVLLSAGDVGHGVSEQDSASGLDQPTNDICGKTWPSNDDRLARQQDFYWEDGEATRLVVSSEAVAYDEGEARSALDEIRRAVAKCGGWKYEQGHIHDMHAVAAPSAALDGSFAWQATDDRPDGKYLYRALYQRQGDLVSAVYVWTQDGDQAAQTVDELASEAATRLREAAGR